MRLASLTLVFVLACSKRSDCPTAEDFQRDTGATVAQSQTAADVCRLGDWAMTAFRCFGEAVVPDDKFKCIEALSQAQADQLEAAMRPIDDEVARSMLAGELDAPRREAFKRVPECAQYRAAQEARFAAALERLRGSARDLEVYGEHQAILAEVDEILRAPAAQHASLCAAKLRR